MSNIDEDISDFLQSYLADEIDTPKNEIIHFDTVEALIEYIKN